MLEQLHILGKEIYWRIKPYLMDQTKVMDLQGKSLAEIVERYPMITVDDLTGRAIRQLTVTSSKKTIDNFRNSNTGRRLVKQAVKNDIRSLSDNYPNIAKRLNRELEDPDIK